MVIAPKGKLKPLMNRSKNYIFLVEDEPIFEVVVDPLIIGRLEDAEIYRHQLLINSSMDTGGCMVAELCKPAGVSLSIYYVMLVQTCDNKFVWRWHVKEYSVVSRHIQTWNELFRNFCAQE